MSSIVYKIGDGYYGVETEDQEVTPEDVTRMKAMLRRGSVAPDEQVVVVPDKGEEARPPRRAVLPPSGI
jgi:hypothetical protein